MPEGPEIRRAADRLRAVLVGHPTTEVVFAIPALEAHGARLTGHTVVAVEARGKALLTTFDDGWSLYSHNQLYGRWDVRGPRAKAPRTTRQERVRLVTARGTARLYSATDVAVLAPGEAADHPFLARLGPDVFAPTTTPEAIATRLLAPAFRRRRLEGLLLDQGFLAGLGNYLRSEVLFLAGLAPERRPADLTEAERLALGTAVRWACQQAYETGGLTVPQARAEALKAAGWPRWRYRHFVFNQPGRPCALCDTPVARKRVGGRRLDTCPTCQPAQAGAAPPPLARLGLAQPPLAPPGYNALEITACSPAPSP
ncbi:MAG: endonuclease VIII [Candidatus Sericytochromatia bacterium]|nr:endonuclease VIII [Candidatus Sericytochromatia bacterium]